MYLTCTMNIKVKKSKIKGEIAVPGSKSHTIRGIAAALCANGTSKLYAPLVAEDTLSALHAAKMLGANIRETGDFVPCWEITGKGGPVAPDGVINMNNSGTGTRILAAVCAACDGTVTFDGDESLRSRPMGQLLDALTQLGVKIASNDGKCPFTLTGPAKGGKVTVDGTSSQFLTALLFLTPRLDNETVIDVVNLNEQPYVLMTLDWLDRLGIKYCMPKDDMTQFVIPGNQQFKPITRTIPADFSTAAFPLGAAAVTGSKLNIRNLDFSDTQGDKAVFDYFEAMGTTVERGDETTPTIVTGPERLRGVTLDLNATPDALPIMAVAGALAKGETRLENVPQARIKETDRIECMTRELRKMGAKVEELTDGMVIQGGMLTGTEVESYGDHRIAMALTVAGLAAAGETTVRGIEAATVTYPGFLDDFKKISAKIEQS
jgi:3-phosphoshikimate 1-carboxyvinyltransferase